MVTVAIVLGFLLLNVILAYVPIVLIVGYNLRPRTEKKKTLYDRYVYGDEVSTAEFIERTNEEWGSRKHASLEPNEGEKQ